MKLGFELYFLAKLGRVIKLIVREQILTSHSHIIKITQRNCCEAYPWQHFPSDFIPSHLHHQQNNQK